MAYRDFKLERFLSLNGLTANSRLVAGPEGQAGRLWPAASLSSGLFCSPCSVHVVLRILPHMPPDAAAKLLQAAHHRDDDERGDQAVFDRSRSALVGAELAQNHSDSAHATLLWSTSTRRFNRARVNNSCSDG